MEEREKQESDLISAVISLSPCITLGGFNAMQWLTSHGGLSCCNKYKKKKEKKERSRLRLPPPASPSDAVRCELTALLAGLSWRRIIEYHVTRPVTARRSSRPVCVRASDPELPWHVVWQPPEAPASCRSWELLSQWSAEPGVLSPGVGFQHTLKDFSHESQPTDGIQAD